MPDPSHGASAVARARATAAGKRTTGGYDADARARDRQETPVTVGGHTFSRRRKVWTVTRRMRVLSRDQERNVALGQRLRLRIAELEAEQAEAATKGETERELELEQQIEELVAKVDAGTEVAEVATYRLLALLLIPPTGEGEAAGRPVLDGFGVLDDEAGNDGAAVTFLQGELDSEDALGILADLGVAEAPGEGEPDPPKTPSNGTGSS